MNKEVYIIDNKDFDIPKAKDYKKTLKSHKEIQKKNEYAKVSTEMIENFKLGYEDKSSLITLYKTKTKKDALDKLDLAKTIFNTKGYVLKVERNGNILINFITNLFMEEQDCWSITCGIPEDN